MLDVTAMRLLAIVLLASCAEVVTEPEPDFDEVARPPPPGEKDQGRWLNGEVSDQLAINGYHLHAERVPALVPPASGTVTRLEAAGGHLTAFDGQMVQFSGADLRFEGIELPLVGSTSFLRIVDISTKDPAAPYIVDIVTKGVATPYCKDHGPAYATPGRWTTSGEHEEAQTINLTCLDGVIWKCRTWGYDPGIASIPGDPRNDPWRVHEACTRMARADRCGDGTSNTFEETSIVIRDRVPGGQPNITDPTVPPLRIPTVDPPPPDVYWFEAAWTEDGAICLSRERWNSMPIDEDSCLPDPRKDPTVQTCDQIGIDNLTNTATFFNSSKIGQLYLNRWQKGAEQLVTVRGMAGEGSAAEPPFPGYVFEEQLGLLMRNPPGSITRPGPGVTDADLDGIAMFRLGTDRVVTATAPTGAYTHVGNEGFVYVQDYVDAHPEVTFLPLHLYQSGGDYVSSVAPPAATGWTDHGIIGYIDQP